MTAERIASPVGWDDLAHHPVARAWRRCAGDQGMPRKIEPLKLNGKTAAYRLHGIGLHGSAVVAKRCQQATAAVERAIHEDILPGLPLSKPRYYGLTADDSDESVWLFLEDAGGEEYSPVLDDHCALAASWLGTFHEATAQSCWRALLPNRGPAEYFRELGAARVRVERGLTHLALAIEDKEVLAGLISRLAMLQSCWAEIDKFCATLPRAVVHGDFVGKNVHVRRSLTGSILLPFDWETAAWGVPVVDMAQFTRHALEPSLTTYWRRVQGGPARLDWADAHRAAYLGRIFRLIDVISWESWSFESDWIAGPVKSLRAYDARLAASLCAGGWGA